MAAKYPDELETEKDSIDDIKPEDSISNVTGPTSSVTSSIARRVKARRAIAAAKLQAIEEEADLAEMERKLNLTSVEEELKIQKRKREVEMRAAAATAAAEIEDEEKLKKLEAEQKRASFEAEKKVRGSKSPD